MLFAAVGSAFHAYDKEMKEAGEGGSEEKVTTGWRDIRALLPVGSAFAAERKIELINRFGRLPLSFLSLHMFSILTLLYFLVKRSCKYPSASR